MEPPKKETSPPPVWTKTLGKGAKVLVLDSGVNPSETLVVMEHRSFIGSDPHDYLGHGTKVSQVIGSKDPCGLGVAPECSLYSAKVLHGPHQSWDGYLLALAWGEQIGVDVINLSFAGPVSDVRIQEVIARLDKAGTIIFASFHPTLQWPHFLPEVISVGGLQTPGDCDIRAAVTYPVKGLEHFQGTSVASAISAGVAACAKAYDKSLNRIGFIETLKAYSEASP